jgi:hypothetical protein
MPAGDGTGPMGQGPMTGRGAGYCAGYEAPGYANPMPGRGFGMGRGRGWWGAGRGAWGRGWRHRNWYHATGMPGWARAGYAPAWGAPPVAAPTPEQEREELRAQAEWLKGQLDAITSRLEELEQAS